MNPVRKPGHFISDQFDDQITEGLGMKLAEEMNYETLHWDLEYQLNCIEEV